MSTDDVVTTAIARITNQLVSPAAVTITPLINLDETSLFGDGYP
ncbi:MAG: hypothetical protein P4L33_19330 [Capsulimonadaceae bacterium]|nr:hypothetical protein [Capsulimonadaceae bacterium]